MRIGTALAGALFAFILTAGSGQPRAETIEADIVVAGGSLSAVAAAFSAARVNPAAAVLLIEPTDWLGGQATSQGVAAIDNAWHEPGASIMRTQSATHYPDDYLDFLARLKAPPLEAPGEGFAPNGTNWVTREGFDPRTAAWIFDLMAAEFPNLTVLKLTVVKSVATEAVSDASGSGLRITGLTLVERTPIPPYEPFDDFLSNEIGDWYDPADSSQFAKATHSVVAADMTAGFVVIDASEIGDVMVLSGATYTQGREATTEEIGLDGSLPAQDELASMAMVYPFAMTDAAAPDDETALKAPFADFDAYLAAQTSSYFSLGSTSWNRVWTYRRLLTTGALFAFDSVNQGDVSMQNWNPGNDYRYTSWLLDKSAAAGQTADWRGAVDTTTLANAEKHAVAWYFWLKARRTTTWDTHYLHDDDPLNMMGTAHGLAKFPYIRGCRRIVGLNKFRITQRYWVNTTAAGYDGGPSYQYFDTVGIGNYAADARPILGSTGIAPSFERPAPFYIPFRALGSANVRNLLASGKAMAQTFITNTGYRLHPIEWSSGSAAGTAAALMASDGLTNYELLEIDNLRGLQAAVDANSPIVWAAYSEPFPSKNGDLIVNDLRPIEANTPFVVEAHHPTAVRAELFVDDEFLAETTQRVNGHLRHASAGIVPTSAAPVFRAVLYDAGGTEIGELTETVPFDGAPCEFEEGVTDNDESELFSVTGSWSIGSAQPDRWCEGTYRFRFGDVSLETATWQLKIPQNGRYEIAVWYPQSTNRATDSPFTVHHPGGSETFEIDQQTGGGQWRALGEWDFTTGGDRRVTLTNEIGDSSKLVVGDAVRARFLRPLDESSFIRIR